MKKNKKIIAIIIAILILAGIIMVATKGFNVSLYLKEHTTLSYTFDQTFEKSDVEEICKEVFENKKFDIRMVEVFDDSVYIISETITDEEQEQLVEKLSNLYSEEESEEEVLEEGEDYYIYHDSNVKLYDILKPYILPVTISAIIIILCMMVRYKILNSGKVIKKTLLIIAESIILLLVILSIIAILRIPINTWILPLLMFLVLVYIVVKFELEIRNKTKEK